MFIQAALTVTTTILLLSLTQAQDCGVGDRIDCGYMGIDQQGCQDKGCCWSPADMNKDVPWCFYPDGGETGDCSNYNWIADSPGFTDEFYNIMKDNYRANLNVEQSGAVVAAPDDATPGGSYYYHWMRDAGLSIKAWMDINDNDYNAVKDVLEPYLGWVDKVQHKNDPNGIDVRIEPKFEIPDGEPYTGGWCRPQTDGPGLRAMAVSKWGLILVNEGMTDAAKSQAWPLVSFDMEWVTANWAQSGCDLWEEFTSDDFYWNRMAFVYSLNTAAEFADAIGESSSASTYRNVANEIVESAKGHYNGQYIYECNGREKDGAVIHAIITFGQYLYPPTSQEAASTVQAWNNAFCNEYPINQQDNGAGKPGILIGRYPGDNYAGGNPWQLLTAAHAEIFYLGASAWARQVQQFGDNQTTAEHQAWRHTLNLDNTATVLDMAKAALGAGDAVMTRLWEYVKNDGGRIDEQIDKHTGAQTSAAALTWSYANILHALHTRNKLVEKLKQLP